MRELSLTNCRLDKRYDVQRRLGQGSYAEIFVARDILASPASPHSLVVIKALNVFLQDDLDPDLERTLVENFQNEAIALDRVRHPNIISRLGHGTARDLAGTIFHYLVLEFMAGGDLQQATRGSQIDLKTAVGYIEQVCAGLRHAHRHNVIHRDIKPQNLLLTADHESVKIADFGVARIHTSDSPVTRVGTNVFAPPEHSPLTSDANSDSSTLSPAADIYSLAKSVYVLLTSESPRLYSGRQIDALPITVRDEPWAGDLLRALKRATSDDPGDRHQTVDEFWADLEQVRRFAQARSPAMDRSRLNASPQPHVSRGYSPLAPQRPRFDTSRDLRLRHPLIGSTTRLTVDLVNGPADRMSTGAVQRAEDFWPAPERSTAASDNVETPPPDATVRRERRKRGILRRIAAFAVFLIAFTGALYGTSAYLRSIGILPEFGQAFHARTGRANTDINLRPEPNVDNEPVGIVTRNSRVRIIRTQNSWHEVEVLEQGRELDEASATRGWLYGRYIDLD